MNPLSIPGAGIPTDTPAKASGLYWSLLAWITVILITVASLVWDHEHPFAFNWDESVYVNEMQTDVNQFHTHGIPGLVKAWLVGDPQRPPAYRVFAFPIALIFGPSPFVLRFVAILFRVITLALIYFGVRRVGTRASAAVSIVLLALCPDFIFFGMVFYNEYALYLAVAGMCFFVIQTWDQPRGSIFNCLGLGIFLGIGALAKASFPALAGCFLGMVVFLGLCRRIAGPSPQFLLNACVVGALIAGPWWALNLRSSLGFVRFAMDFSRHGVGSGGANTAFLFILRFLQEGLGLLIGCFCIALLLAAAIRHFRARQSQPLDASFWAMICLLLAPLPIVLAPLITRNQVMYHTSPALILLAAGFALLAKNEGWLTSSVRSVVLSAVIFGQLVLTLIPVILREDYSGQRYSWTTLARWDQWDWNQLRVLLRSQGLKQPSIAYLGDLSPLNPQGVMYPWLSRHEKSPSVTLLWKLEYGVPSMPALLAAADTNDVVFTVPELSTAKGVSPDLQDDKYNTDFATQMSNDPHFETPMHLRLGRFRPLDVWVFIRKNDHDLQALHTAVGQQIGR